MKQPKEFFVLYKNKKGEFKDFWTNDAETAERVSTIRCGTVYVDTRYKAKVRLHWYLVRKEMYK
jgi:hypothetical protein